jgi:hypothetical protein
MDEFSALRHLVFPLAVVLFIAVIVLLAGGL